MKRLLRPILLEFCRTHLILTACAALLTVLTPVLCSLLGLGATLADLFPFPLQWATTELRSAIPALLPMALCLLAYLPAGRLTRKRNLLPRPDVEEALLLLLLPAAAFWLLLAHRNTDYDLYAQCGVDVTLCGHGHGGVIRLPFTDGLLSTDRTFFPSYTAGLYALEYGQLVVSRGLGNSGPSFRLFNRPHLPVVVLEQKR